MWTVAAICSGAIAYFAILYRFQTYSQRNNLPGSTYVIFAAVVFLLGFGLALLARLSGTRIGSLLLAGVFAAHAVIIGIDVQQDPTNHNLLPFEFIIFFVLGSPAYAGAWLARFARR